MNTWNIKGLCESCGFAYKGTISSNDSAFPRLKCPNCHKETSNFNEAHDVDHLNKVENSTPDYKESVFEVIK